MRLLLITFLLGSLPVVAQSWKFRKEAKEIMTPVDTTYVITAAVASDEPYEFLTEGVASLNAYFLSQLKENSRNRPDTLRKSENLSLLASLATKFWRSSSHYADKKKWGKLDKYFRRASNQTNFNFGIMKQVSFRVPLVKLIGRKFYYDPKGKDGGSNLYMGKRPLTKEERENQIALGNYSMRELGDLFMDLIPRKIRAELDKGNIAYVGLNVELDKNSINRTRIPTARVVVVFGAKRFRNVRQKSASNEE